MTTETIVQDHRDATALDAQSLGRLYNVVLKAIKAHKKAVTAVKDAWLLPEKKQVLRDARDQAQYELDECMDEAWDALTALPPGTVAPGGATPQTVGLQLFNRNLNRSLKARLTAADARDANRRSFG